MLQAQRVVSEVTDAMVNRKAIYVAATTSSTKPVSRNTSQNMAQPHQPLLIKEDSEQMRGFPQNPPLFLTRPKVDRNSKKSLLPEEASQCTFLQRANDAYERKNPVYV